MLLLALMGRLRFENRIRPHDSGDARGREDAPADHRPVAAALLREMASTLAASVEGKDITTIESLGANGLAPIQQAWIDHQVPQCGYCQSGMIMAISALLSKNPHPTDQDLSDAITNICRCGTYPRIRAAVRALSEA